MGNLNIIVGLFEKMNFVGQKEINILFDILVSNPKDFGGFFGLHLTKFSFQYTGGLTAFMTSPDNTLPINNLKDLETKTSAKWVTVKGTALESFIKVQK